MSKLSKKFIITLIVVVGLVILRFILFQFYSYLKQAAFNFPPELQCQENFRHLYDLLVPYPGENRDI